MVPPRWNGTSHRVIGNTRSHSGVSGNPGNLGPVYSGKRTKIAFILLPARSFSSPSHEWNPTTSPIVPFTKPALVHKFIVSMTLDFFANQTTFGSPEVSLSAAAAVLLLFMAIALTIGSPRLSSSRMLCSQTLSRNGLKYNASLMNKSCSSFGTLDHLQVASSPVFCSHSSNRPSRVSRSML